MVQALVTTIKEDALRHKYNAHDRGFTIPEVLISIAILAFGLLAVMTMIDVTYTWGSFSRNMTNATELAQDILDRIRMESASTAQPFSTDVDNLSTFDNDGTAGIIMDTENANPAADPALAAFTRWQPLVRVLPNGRGVVNIIVNDPANANNHTVTVTVTWRSVLPRGVVVQTILTR